MANNVQNNILITRNGQACLGDFGLTGAFPRFHFSDYGLTTLRFMAPEWFVGESTGDLGTSRPSKESDVYSLAMTSFSVRSSVLNRPATCNNLPAITRSLRGPCPTMAIVVRGSTGVF